MVTFIRNKEAKPRIWAAAAATTTRKIATSLKLLDEQDSPTEWMLWPGKMSKYKETKSGRKKRIILPNHVRWQCSHSRLNVNRFAFISMSLCHLFPLYPHGVWLQYKLLAQFFPFIYSIYSEHDIYYVALLMIKPKKCQTHSMCFIVWETYSQKIIHEFD